MNENWTDFEKYVFEKLEMNSKEHQSICIDLAILHEKIKTKPKRKFFAIKLTAIVAALAGVCDVVRRMF